MKDLLNYPPGRFSFGDCHELLTQLEANSEQFSAGDLDPELQSIAVTRHIQQSLFAVYESFAGLTKEQRNVARRGIYVGSAVTVAAFLTANIDEEIVDFGQEEDVKSVLAMCSDAPQTFLNTDERMVKINREVSNTKEVSTSQEAHVARTFGTLRRTIDRTHPEFKFTIIELIRLMDKSKLSNIFGTQATHNTMVYGAICLDIATGHYQSDHPYDADDRKSIVDGCEYLKHYDSSDDSF